MSKYTRQLEEDYVNTTYAAIERDISIAVCDYCDREWKVRGSEIKSVESTWIPARTSCLRCGRYVRVYEPSFRNKFMAIMNTSDPFIPLFVILVGASLYLMAFLISFVIGYGGLIFYALLIAGSAFLGQHIRTRHVNLPQTPNGDVDYDKIRDVLYGERYEV